MGHHIQPRHYLRGFAQPDETRLWRYEKGKKQPQFLPIDVIAQENKLYADVEGLLAQVEGPAHRVLNEIRNTKSVSLADKDLLSKYIFLFYKRVKCGYKRFCDNIPKISKEVMEDFFIRLDHCKTIDPNKADYYDGKKVETKNMLDGYREEPPKDLWSRSLLVGNNKPIEYLNRMNWLFLTCKDPDFFLTNDNPVYFHSGITMDDKRYEMSFPISRGISIWATWGSIEDLSYYEANSSIVKEMNRRMAHNAERFIYAPFNRDWIMEILNKKKHYLRVISPSIRSWYVVL